MNKQIAISSLKSHVASLAAEKRARSRAGAAAADEMERQWMPLFARIETELPDSVFDSLADDADINEIRSELVGSLS